MDDARKATKPIKKPMTAADWARGVAFEAEPKLGARLIELE